MQVKNELEIVSKPDLDFDGFARLKGFSIDDNDDDESTLSDSVLFSEEGEVAKKRRITDCRIKRRVRIPRMLVKDIRKLYATMFINSINSGEFPLLYGFLDTYYDHHTAHYSLTKYSPGGVDRLFTMNFFGLDEVGKYWYSILKVSPDNIVRILGCVIQPSTGKIICRFQKKATQIYVDPPGATGYYAPYVFVDKKYGNQVASINNGNDEIVVGKSSEASFTTTSSTSSESSGAKSSKEDDKLDSKFLAMREIMDSVDGVVKELPLQDPPRSVIAEGMFIISTDTNKRITKIEVKVGF